MDLLVKSLLALGASRKDVAKAIAAFFQSQERALPANQSNLVQGAAFAP